MKRIFVILTAAAAVILSGCHKEVTDAINDMNNTKVDFTYSVSGMTVSFTPQCDTKVTGFEWFFGDEGSTKIPYPSHTFKTAGTHKVHLTGTWYTDGKLRTKDCMHEVTVKSSGEGGQQDAKTAYIKGFRVDKTPYTSGFNYKFKCIGVDLWDDVSLNINTPYTADKITTFPYTYKLTTPARVADLPDPFSWYKTVTIGAYIKLNDGSDEPVIERTIDAYLLNGKTEYTIESTLSKLTLLIEYK
jgi:PKD repeat protein